MNKEEMQKHAFQAWCGHILMERHKAHPEAPVKIDDDYELLERAFRSGWAWGERQAEEEK